jgi:hypothetical protein
MSSSEPRPATDPAAIAALQEEIADVIRRYAASIGEGADFAPVDGREALSATEVATICSRLLKAANMEVFELAVWDSWNS